MICIHMPVSRLVLVDFIQDMDEIHCCQTSCIPPGHGCLDMSGGLSEVISSSKTSPAVCFFQESQ